MPKIPRISGKQAVKAFEKIDYQVVRQKGSHIRMVCSINKNQKPLTVPDHKELGIGLVRKLLRDADISVEEFIKLLK